MSNIEKIKLNKKQLKELKNNQTIFIENSRSGIELSLNTEFAPGEKSFIFDKEKIRQAKEEIVAALSNAQYYLEIVVI